MVMTRQPMGNFTGKSAYEQAVEGGYSGTEEQFGELLAMVTDQIVTGTVNGAGDLILTTATGDEINAGPVKGEDGSNVIPTSEAIATALTTPGAPKTALDAAIADQIAESGAASSMSALGILRAMLAQRDTMPVVMVGIGNSIMFRERASNLASSWFARLVAAFQATYPLASGEASPDTVYISGSVASATRGPGVQGINAGNSGTTVVDWFTTTWKQWLGMIDAHIYFVYFETNEFATGITPAVYKSTLMTQLADVDSRTPGPNVYILIHGMERWEDGLVPTAPWSEYGKATREIAQSDPSKYIYVDLDAPFRAVGVPGADPLDVMNSDKIHPNNTGHVMMFDILRAELGLLPFAVTGGTPPAPEEASVYTARASDSFTAGPPASMPPSSDTRLEGRATDSFAGGTSKTWQSNQVAGVGQNAINVASGEVVLGGSVSEMCVVPTGYAFFEVSIKFKSMGAGGTKYLYGGMTQIAGGAGQSMIRVNLNFSAGNVQLAKVIAGGSSVTLGATHAIVAGDVIALRRVTATRVKLLINGVVVETITDSTLNFTCAFAGIGSGGTAIANVDEFKVGELTLT